MEKEKIAIVESVIISLSDICINKGQIEGLPANPRIIHDDKYKKLVKSIEDNPEMTALRELLVYKKDGKYVIIGGNMRFRAMKELGYKEAICKIIPPETTLEELKAYVIKDNSGFGEWDFDLIKDNWNMGDVENWGVDIPDKFKISTVEEDDFDAENELNLIENAKSKIGDIYKLGEHRLMCGDCTKREDVELLMDGKKADMVFTDPPYGVDYSEKNTFLNAIAKGNRIQTPIKNDNIEDYNLFYNGFLKHFKNILNDFNSFYITISGQNLLQLLEELKKLEYKISQILVWCKNNHVLGRQDYSNKHELIIYGWIGKHKFYGGFQTTIWEIDKPLKSDLHPTMKPISLISRAINNSSKINDLILDVFGGSGSTLIASEQLNRKCYMMEIEPKYVDLIIKRWENYTQKKAKYIGNFNEFGQNGQL